MKGWISWHRQIMDHWLYKEKRVFSRYEAWLDIVMRVNHTDNKILHDGKLEVVLRGSTIWSLGDMEKHWGWSNTKVKRFLNQLVEDEMLTYKSTTRKTYLTVVNYDKYQGEDGEKTPPKHNKNISKAFQKHTNNNGNKENNENNDNNKPSSPNKKTTYSEDNKYYQMAVYFYNKVMEHAVVNKKDHLVRNANLQKWADEFRKIIELDKRDGTELKSVIDWATSDSFWQRNILSPSKLRGENYVQLAMKMDQKPNQQIGSTHKNRQMSQNEILMQEIKEELEHEQSGAEAVIPDNQQLLF